MAEVARTRMCQNCMVKIYRATDRDCFEEMTEGCFRQMLLGVVIQVWKTSHVVEKKSKKK